MSDKGAAARRGILVGTAGLLLALCCVLVPILFGVAIGAALGGAVDLAAALMLIAGVAIALRHLR